MSQEFNLRVLLDKIKIQTVSFNLIHARQVQL